MKVALSVLAPGLGNKFRFTKSAIVLLVILFHFSHCVLGQKQKEIELILECVEYVGNGMYKANFGYKNPNKKNIRVPEGDSYVLYNNGQAKKKAVNNFEVGRQFNVFSQEFKKGDKCEWELILPNGTIKTKSSSVNSVHCSSKGIEPYYNPTSKVNELIGSELTSLFDTYNNTGNATSDSIYQINAGNVLIDIIVQKGSISDVENLLLSDYNVVPEHISMNDLIISAYFPIAFLDQLNARFNVINFVRPVYPAISNNSDVVNTGVVTQGDDIQRSSFARNKFDLGGKDIKVGVISDSYNKSNTDNEALDISRGDLPSEGVMIAYDGKNWDNPYGGIDEGRAMLQIIHDVAPEASLAFRTGFISESDFAQGIYDLFDLAGCDIIVDDIIYITEPFYRSGLVSQAIDDVSRRGATYFTSAGNFGSNASEFTFSPCLPAPIKTDICSTGMQIIYNE